MYYLAAAYTVRVMTARDYLLKAASRDRDAGNIPENVILIAGFALLAILVVGIITAKVLAKANSIDLDGTTSAR